METLAREIAGPNANVETEALVRQVAEAQIDLRRVRYARHKSLSDALANPIVIPGKRGGGSSILLRETGRHPVEMLAFLHDAARAGQAYNPLDKRQAIAGDGPR